MDVVRSRYAGACYGVERALSMVRTAVDATITNDDSTSHVHTLGPLIHNPQVVSELRESGVEVAETLDDVTGGTLVIRSHGVVPALIDEARARDLNVVDATCPHVSKAHKAAARLKRDGYRVIVVGEAGHPEVESICAYAGDDAVVVQEPSDLPAILPTDKIGVVVQTTQSAEVLEAIVDTLGQTVDDLAVCNTVCFATQQRQRAARELAADVDAMVVVGGRNSGNTTRLYQICLAVCPHTYHIEGADELDPRWFIDSKRVGVTAGASTPEDQIVTVIHALESFG